MDVLHVLNVGMLVLATVRDDDGMPRRHEVPHSYWAEVERATNESHAHDETLLEPGTPNVQRMAACGTANLAL